MLDQPSSPPKPVTQVWRPDLVGLPRLTFGRRLFRIFMWGLTKLLTFLLLRARVSGLENFPRHGPAVLAFNHLGDADAVLMMGSLPLTLRAEAMGRIELNEYWLVGLVFRLYGVIWVHRGLPDRKALRAALDGLAEGRMICLAPEGRQSLIAGLEEGNPGAAFLALNSEAPVVPVVMTGTENKQVFGHLKRWRRAPVTLTVGKPFRLPAQTENKVLNPTKGHKTLQEGTSLIMEKLAALLPESYRGMYRSGPGK